jgi:hypothetical protein
VQPILFTHQEITIAQLPSEIGRYRAAHNRMFGGYAPSLDAPIGEDGFTLGNTLAAAYI